MATLIANDAILDKSVSTSIFHRCSESPMTKLKPLNDETASTDAGDDSPLTDAISTPRTSSSEDCAFSDSEAGDECKSNSSDATCVYPIMVLLQLRAAMNLHGGALSSRSCGPEQQHVPEPSKASRPSWTSKQRLSARNGTNSDDEHVSRAVRSLLNKLTIEKFDSIFEQLANCGMKAPAHITILMHEVFEKATLQHHFIPMYADLCVRLESDQRIACIAGPTGEQQSFQRLLLNQCQIRFEQLLENREAQDELDEESQIRRKQQALGNVKLIGELLVRKMLCSKLFVECAEELLRLKRSCPEALESLATLLMVAGAAFDTVNYRYHGRFAEIVANVRELTTDASTPARIRFLLRDVLDVRDAGWSTSKNQAAVRAAPMRLEEVREQAKDELRNTGNQTPAFTSNAISHRGIPKERSSGNWKPSLRHSTESDTRGSNAEYYSKPKKHKQVNERPAGGKKDLTQQQKQCDLTPPLSAGHEKLHGKALTSKSGAFAMPVSNGASYNQRAQQPADAASEARAAVAAVPQSQPAAFSMVSFRREVAATLRELGSCRNVKAGLERIRAQQVPVEHQAKQFADILTRSVEELRNPIRRLAFTFVAGLAAGEHSVFDHGQCFEGLRIFFDEVYFDLCDEVKRLPNIIMNELLPTLSNIFTTSELRKILPSGLQV